jgi:hypothetical protein
MMTIKIPFEHRIFLDESVEIGHKLVYCFSHVHVPDSGPYGVMVRQRGGLIFIGSNGRLEFIPVSSIS